MPAVAIRFSFGLRNPIEIERMADMDLAFRNAHTLATAGIGFLVILLLAWGIARYLVKEGNRKRFIRWSVAVYMVCWAVYFARAAYQLTCHSC